MYTVWFWTMFFIYAHRAVFSNECIHATFLLKVEIFSLLFNFVGWFCRSFFAHICKIKAKLSNFTKICIFQCLRSLIKDHEMWRFHILTYIWTPSIRSYIVFALTKINFKTHAILKERINIRPDIFKEFLKAFLIFTKVKLFLKCHDKS